MVGLVVFSILVVINFVVITKGAGRVAEVAARFTLDAMPGKQMAIDAELNAGHIDEPTARRRRDSIMREADFYGAMDGASKFIRGDAIAGILITLINIVGGIIIGVVQNGLDLSTALENYTVLTIGDVWSGRFNARHLGCRRYVGHARPGQRLPGTTWPVRLTAVQFTAPDDAVGFATLLCSFRVCDFHSSFSVESSASPHGRTATTTLTSGLGTEGKPAVGADGQAVDASGAAEESDEETTLENHDGGSHRHRAWRGPHSVGRREQGWKPRGADLSHPSSDGSRPGPHHSVRPPPGQPPPRRRRVPGRSPGRRVGRGRVVPRQHLAINPGDAEPNLSGLKCIDPVFGLEALWITDKNKLDARARATPWSMFRFSRHT